MRVVIPKMAGAPWTAEEIMFLWENRGKMTAKQMAEALKRSYRGVVWKLKTLDKAGNVVVKRKAKTKPIDDLDERFKNPLLCVAINRAALPRDWTPIDRLDELWMYEGRHEGRR